MYDYTMYADTPEFQQFLEKIVIAYGFMIVLALIGLIITLICTWKIFKKAGQPGWGAIIPVYNTVILFQISGVNPLAVLWMLLPGLGGFILAIYQLVAYYRLAKAFGKESGFGIGLCLLNPIFMAILAFDQKCIYIGVPQK